MLQLLEAEHLPLTLNTELPSGNVIRSGIEFDAMGRRVCDPAGLPSVDALNGGDLGDRPARYRQPLNGQSNFKLSDSFIAWNPSCSPGYI